MKTKPGKFLEQHRITKGCLASDARFGNNGHFLLPAVDTHDPQTLSVQASDGGAWDHVSVSIRTRCPTWDEMCSVKRLFFRANEWVVQFHPPEGDNINCHPYCLHLWRQHFGEPLIPPVWMVGPSK